MTVGVPPVRPAEGFLPVCRVQNLLISVQTDMAYRPFYGVRAALRGVYPRCICKHPPPVVRC